jgi:hypothetical protein
MFANGKLSGLLQTRARESGQKQALCPEYQRVLSAHITNNEVRFPRLPMKAVQLCRSEQSGRAPANIIGDAV